MKRAIGIFSAALVMVAAASATPAFAQAPPGIDPAQIEGMIKAELDKAPQKEIQIEGICKITYKEIPSDPAELVKNNPQLQQYIPAGFNMDAMAKQYAPMIQEYLNKYLADIATFEAFVDLKFKSKKIPTGKYKMGLAFTGADIEGAQIYGEGLEKPIQIKFKTKVNPTPSATLVIELEKNEKEEKKGVEAVDIVTTFAKSAGKSISPIEKK